MRRRNLKQMEPVFRMLSLGLMLTLVLRTLLVRSSTLDGSSQALAGHRLLNCGLPDLVQQPESRFALEGL